MSIQTVGGEAPKQPPRAPAPAAPAPGNVGLTEQEAGDAFAAYMANHGNDLSMFDSDADERRTAEAVPSPPSSPDEGEPPRRADGADDAGGEGEGAASAAQQQDDPGGADEGLEVTELADYIGVAPERLIVSDDGQLQYATTVNGQQQPVTFDALVKSYQTEAAVTQRSQQLAAERQQMEQELNERRAGLDQALQQAAFMGQAARQAVTERWERVNWGALEQQDPGRYAMLDRQREAELAAIDAQVGQMQTLYQQQQQQIQAEQTAQYESWLNEQRAGVQTHIPELLDPDTSTALMTGFEAYLTGYGFTPQELKDLKDHRILRVVHDAYRFTQGAAQAQPKQPKVPVAKRLAKVPRQRRPGASQEGTTAAPRTRVRRARQRLQKTGSDADAAMFAVESGVVDALL